MVIFDLFNPAPRTHLFLGWLTHRPQECSLCLTPNTHTHTQTPPHPTPPPPPQSIPNRSCKRIILFCKIHHCWTSLLMIPSPPQKEKFKYLSAAVFHYNLSDNSKWEYYDNYTAGRPPHTLTHLTQSGWKTVLPEWIPSHLHNAVGAQEIVGRTTTEFWVPDRTTGPRVL